MIKFWQKFTWWKCFVQSFFRQKWIISSKMCLSSKKCLSSKRVLFVKKVSFVKKLFSDYHPPLKIRPLKKNSKSKVEIEARNRNPNWKSNLDKTCSKNIGAKKFSVQKFSWRKERKILVYKCKALGVKKLLKQLRRASRICSSD